MKPEIGLPAPDFSLFSSEKKEIHLSELKGQNVLLLFFPFAFTSTCTKELCSVRDEISYYNGMNATVFGISVDSIYTLARYKEEQKLTFTLLSDFNKEVSKSYDVFYEAWGFGMKGVSKRAAFLIDSGGILRYAEILEDAGLIPDFERIRAALESLK
jgi:peroxiredoxin